MTRDEARTFLAAWETEHALLSRKPLYELVAIAQSEREALALDFGAWGTPELVGTIMRGRGMTGEKLAEAIRAEQVWV